ncbi:hypothetical protein C8J57DRAFT_1476112 [Mycena rebaudengoi]|nr:hypothetical protein C8J57DRAFT_1476112 [Mycena rebaudengoi]
MGSCTLALFTLICVYASLVAGQANRTVDDFSPLLSYSPVDAVTHLDTTDFDVTRLNNRTVAVMNSGSTASASLSMTLKFTGTALWLFFAKPATAAGRTSTASYTIFLDGAVVLDVGTTPLDADAVYGALAYSNTSLRLGAHEVTLRINDGGTTYFDYAVFTSDDPNPETSITPPVQPPASTGTQPKGTGTPDEESTATGGGKPKTNIAVIAGAVAGGVFLLLAACLAMLFLRRRRRRGGVHPRPIYNSPQRKPAQASKESASSGSTDKLTLAGGGALPHLPQHFAAQQPHKLEYKPAYGYSEDSDSVTGTSASDPDAEMRRMLAEQREIVAEYARPDPAAWGADEKKAPLGAQTLAPPAPPSSSSTSLAPSTSLGISNPDPAAWGVDEKKKALPLTQQPGAPPAPPSSTSLAHSSALESARPDPTAWGVDEKKKAPLTSTSLGIANPDPLAHSPSSLAPSASASTSLAHSPSLGILNPDPDPEMSRIAAQMRALQAQVARLEVERGTQLQLYPAGEEVPPPAYAGI